MGYVDAILAKGMELTPKRAARLSVLRQVYEQQKYMYENNTHTVPDRIVSISQPYIRPIVRGKAAAPVEFGSKLDLSIDENGMARLEKRSFDAYNESDVLIGAIQRKMLQLIKKRNILTMLTVWKSNDHSALPRDAMDLAGS